MFGTAAWAIEGDTSKGHIVGSVIVPGTPKDQSAYRSKLAGIYSIFVGVKQICHFFKLLKEQLTWIAMSKQLWIRPSTMYLLYK
jgi:hypothetical protein